MEKVLNSLMNRQTSAERLFEGLALALDTGKVLPLEALLPVLQLMQRNAAVTDDEEIADCMGFVIDRLQAHASARHNGGSPLQTLLLQTETFCRTPPHLRSALESWLSAATTEEIADELSPLLRQRTGTDARPGTAPDEPGVSGA